ncbi:MAG: SDR family NAD(P)-dependent oxidoreductase [Anaerolineaceae bacterium]|jgi:NAD(P)-dependent dehydrogenase (short-subunit alcohol dehydrogenase family)
MQDKSIVITGGTDGIGKATAAQLAAQGGHLLLVGRNPQKGEQAVSDIVRSSGNHGVTYFQADLSLMRDVLRLVTHICRTFDRLDVLMHSAGKLFPTQCTLTSEGVEISFALQYLARYLLTNRLIELLRSAPTPQVISIAGGGNSSGKIEFDNLNGEKRYTRFGAIAKSSATNDALALAQATCYQDITFYCYGPGLVRPGIGQRMPLPARLVMNTLGRIVTRSPEQAAHDIVTLLSGGYPGGLYTVSLKRNNSPVPLIDGTVGAQLLDYSDRLLSHLLKNDDASAISAQL